MARHSDTTRSTFSPSKDECSPSIRLLIQAMAINLLTPKTYLLSWRYCLSSPGRQPRHWLAQILVFGVIHIIGCAAVYLAGEYGEATVLANRPKVAITVRILSGIGLGIEQTITT